MPRVPKNKLPPVTNSNETIGQRIARFRKTLGMTQKQLAEKIGIDRFLVSDYERGKIRLYDEMLARFAIALKVSTDELLGIKKNNYDKHIPSLRLMRRIYKIDILPENKKKAILKTIDDLIKANS